MAADMQIHVMTDDVTEQDLGDFFANTLGSKWFDLRRAREAQMSGRWDAAYRKIADTPSYPVGEVSWLKAALTEDGETFIPTPVQAVHEIIGGDLPVIDDVLIDRLVGAMTRGNTTAYATDKKLGQLRKFLEKHKGRRIFTVSW